MKKEKAKTNWQLHERPGCQMRGEPSATARDFPYVVILGGSGAGKSSLESLLLKKRWLRKKDFLPLPRFRTRERRNGDTRFRHRMGYRKMIMSYKKSQIESSYGFFCPPYAEWENAKDLLGLKPPTQEELIGSIGKCWLCIRIRSLEKQCRKAAKQGRGIVITLTTQDGLWWGTMFPNSLLYYVTADPIAKRDRLIEREGGSLSPLMTARLFDSVTEPPPEQFAKLLRGIIINDSSPEDLRQISAQIISDWREHISRQIIFSK